MLLEDGRIGAFIWRMPDYSLKADGASVPGEAIMGSVWAFLRKPAMRVVGLVLLAVCAWWPVLGAAEDAVETEKIADLMVRLCVGGGHTEATSGTAAGGADLSLRSLDVRGNLKGEFKINKSSAEGLVNGLDNALSQVAADQADKVRACLRPVRERLLDVMLPPKKQGGQTVSAPGGVAVGGDVKNSPITVNNPPSQSGGR